MASCPSIAAYERAAGALVCPDVSVVRLDHVDLRPLLLNIMRRNNLMF
jgi:hypothetical protein